MRIAFAGTPEPAVATLQQLVTSQHDVAFCVSRPDAPAGRGRTLTASEVAQFCGDAGMECLKPTHFESVAGRLQEVDCVVVVAYGQLIPANLLDVPRYGFLNVHYSLLPRWRGAAPVQHAVHNGDTQTGVTVFRLDAGLDTGAVLLQESVLIKPTDTATTLLKSLSVVGAQCAVSVLDAIDQGLAKETPQDDEGVTYAPKISTAFARVDWTQTAVQVDRHIRSVTDVPGAWTMCGDERIKLGAVEIVDAVTDLMPGQVSATADAVHVGTGLGAVKLSTVQRAGRTAVAAHQWAATTPKCILQ